MVGKLHLHPKRQRFGFDVMELADSTRADDNEYLDWLQGEFPMDRWAMAHGATPNGWIRTPQPPARGEDAHLLVRLPAPLSTSKSATPPVRSSSTSRSSIPILQ